MSRKIGIIGMGNVGCAVAHSLIVQEVADSYVFIDANEDVARANQLDFQDAFVNMGVHAEVVINDWSALSDADIVISTLGNIKLLQDNSGGERSAELRFTSTMVQSVGENLRNSGFQGVLIVISNPVDVITTLFQAVTGFEPSRIIGSGTLVDTARMRRAVGNVLGVDPRSVSGYVLGEHGNSQFVAWSTIRALGRSVGDLELNFDDISETARKGGFDILNAKGFTNFGISAAAVRIAKAVLSDAREELVVSNLDTEHKVCTSYPAIVGRRGIVRRCELELTTEEMAKLQAARSVIASQCETIRSA